jgi:head-tail adaptor
VTGLLSIASLARCRTVFAKSLAEACTISRNTRVSDGAGGWKDGWATVETTTCNVAPTGNQPQERAIADRLGSVVSYTIALPAETAISASDRVVVGSRTFEVVGVIARTNELTRRCVCREVR